MFFQEPETRKSTEHSDVEIFQPVIDSEAVSETLQNESRQKEPITKVIIHLKYLILVLRKEQIYKE